MLLIRKLVCRHCRTTEHTVLKRNVNKRDTSALAHKPLGTNLLQSQELYKASIWLDSLIILTALLKLCIFIFLPQTFYSSHLLPSPFISDHFWQVIQQYQPLLWRSPLYPVVFAPALWQTPSAGSAGWAVLRNAKCLQFQSGSLRTTETPISGAGDSRSQWREVTVTRPVIVTRPGLYFHWCLWRNTVQSRIYISTGNVVPEFTKISLD